MSMGILPIGSSAFKLFLDAIEEGFINNRRVESRNDYWLPRATVVAEVILQRADVSLISQYPGNVVDAKSLCLFCSISFIVQVYDDTLVAHALVKLFEDALYKRCRFLIDNWTAHDSSSLMSLLPLDNFSPVAVWGPEDQMALLRSL